MDALHPPIGKLVVMVWTLWGGSGRNVYIPPSIEHQSQQFGCLVTWVSISCSAAGLPEMR